MYLGEQEIETKYGTFQALTFLDLINKSNVIALIKGDIFSKTLYTRVHSSCITSETLRSQDCDCVEQLNGAIKKISESENGILFYLIQEGRGCGYIGKARACMMCQHQHDKITTFDAYNELGMNDDYRSYHNIKEILIILGIYETSEFVLLSNNPDKINGLLNLGVKIKNSESIEYQPNIFNQSYLISKKKMGHKLNDVEIKIKKNKYSVPESIELFDPYYLKNNNRYIYCASYYIPIRPVDNWILLKPEQIFKFKDLNLRQNIYNKYLFKIDDKVIEEKNIYNPYWFKVNLFYDIVNNTDIVILTHENDNKTKDTVPVVRFHSESIFNRFPLKERKYQNKYKNSILKIIENGYGIITLFHYDGKGSGLGYYILNKNKDIVEDKRDYNSIIYLLKKFLYINKIDILFSDSSYDLLKETLKINKIQIRNWIALDTDKDINGVIKRNEILKSQINEPLNLSNFKVNKNDKFLITGLGCSKYHANYFIYKFRKKYDNYIEFISIDSESLEKKLDYKLIIISQAISINNNKIIKKWNYDNLIFISSNSAKKKKIFTSIKDCPKFLYPEEIPDDTLIRIYGPVYVLKVIDHILSFETYKYDIKDKKINFNDNISNYDIYIISNSDYCQFLGNLGMRIMEGLRIKMPIIIDYYNFSHGYYQNSVNENSKTLIFSLDLSNDENKKIKKMYDNKKIIIESFNFNHIIEYELLFNNWIVNMISKYNIRQDTWFGKKEQNIIYLDEN